MPYSNSRAPPPTEDYLYNLYEQVRLGFESESSTSLNDVRDSMNGDEVGRIIDDYGGQNGAGRSDLPKYDKSRTPTSPPLEKVEGKPFTTPTSPPGGRRRPLPNPPVAASSSGSSSNNVSISMPEPQPYQQPTNSAQQANGQRRTSGTPTGGPRRLPSAPDAGKPSYTPDGQGRPSSSSSIEGGRVYNAPPPPRIIAPPPPPLPPSISRTSDSPASGSSYRPPHPYATATPKSQLQSPVIQTKTSTDSALSNTNGHASSKLPRPDSARPRGALPPAVPGQSTTYPYRESPTSPATSSSSADFYASSPGEIPAPYTRPSEPPKQNYRPIDPALRSYSPIHVPAMPPPRGGVNGSISNSSLPKLDPYSRHSTLDDQQSLNPPSAVATNNTLTTHSMLEAPWIHGNLGRSSSTSTTSSMLQPGPEPATTPATSIQTGAVRTSSAGPSTSSALRTGSMNRGGSLSSFNSIGSGGSGQSTSRNEEPPYDVYRSSSSMDVPARAGTAAASSSRMDRFNQRSQRERVIDDIKRQLALHEWDENEEDVSDGEEEDWFVNLALLSHIAVRLKDRVPRGTHVKGGIPYSRAFTGKDIVSTIQAQIQRELVNMHISANDRRLALHLARSLQSQLFFYEVEWGGRVLQDGVEDVYMFLDDQEGGADRRDGEIREREELPTGVFTPLTKCYSPSCVEGQPYACLSWSCPRRKGLGRDTSISVEPSREPKSKEWSELIDNSVLQSLPESEINRQTIIHRSIDKEGLYVQDLDLIESLFMKPLRTAEPAIIPADQLDSFMEDVFHNILDLRDVNRRLLEVMAVRQREQYPIIQKIGDVFLTAAADFRIVYANYLGNLPVAEKRLKDETEHNADFRRFLEQCLRATEPRRMELKHFLNRPAEHLQKYPAVLEAIFNETADGNPDADFLLEAVQALKKLQTVAQLRTFQAAMGKGPTGKLEWHDLTPEEVRNAMSKQEQKRQAIIFELIKGEMMYVKDLEAIGTMYIQPLKTADPPIIPSSRLSSFLHDVYHNYLELLHLHRRLLERLHEIQRDEHPMIRSITAPIMDAALNWREAYTEYVPNYPISHYRIDDEMQTNPDFKAFADGTQKHPDSRRLDMKNFVHRPVARLARYELLLASILKETPPSHEDREAIPHVQEVLKVLLKETETGVQSSKERVEIWRYNQSLIFKPGEAIDMDLLDENRSLIYSGKLLRQPETGFDWNNWTELFVLLFDNYLVMTKPKEKDGITKYQVYRRPIPLDLLTLVNFNDLPQLRSKGIFGRSGGSQHTDSMIASAGQANQDATPGDSRSVYPCTIHHNGRLGGLWTVYAETLQARNDWKRHLDEAIVLRKVVTDANKVFEIETLSSDTFLVPSMHANQQSSSWNDENVFTGKVTCSVPFSTPDGRGLVAIGCAEGVWIGLRHDPRSMRRVLHLKMVTQCAMLEDFGIFLVLADKALFAYHIEALVPSSPPNANASRTPQKLNGNKDVQFFTVGTLNGRTLVIYMKKKGLESIFRVLEPVIGKINEKTKTSSGLSRFGFGSQRSEWFRIFRDFFLPSESYDLIFLKARIAILCSKGFEIMDLTDFRSVTIPQRDDPSFASLTKRCESCKPMGMFKSSESEFLLCYDEFGLYVDRHGDPSRSVTTIEWEGTAERVAWHPPYILLFDSRFIEIRHVETGRLAQIISGNDIRCIWDGRGSNIPPVGTPGPDGWTDGVQQEPRIHAVMQASETTGSKAPSRAIAQHVFQLVPTIPLYLPGSLSSPSNSTYFPQTASPPRSPPMTPRHSWR